MAVTKPTKKPRFAVDTDYENTVADIVEPSEGEKTNGWSGGEEPPAQYFNWLHNLVARWVAYLEQQSDDYEARIAANETDISNLGTAFANIASDVAENLTKINANTDNITDNASNISTNASNISTNASNITTNASNISSNTSRLDNLKASEVENDSSVSGSTVKDALNVLNSSLSAPTPIGAIMPFAGDTLPDNTWLFCKGGNYSKTGDYSALYAVIGNTYDNGSTGTSEFGIPDLRGAFPMGVSPTHALGTTGGEERVSLSLEEMPNHKHDYINSRYAESGNKEGGNNNNENGDNNRTETTYSVKGHTLTATETPEDRTASVSHENLPPFTVFNYIIKAK